MKEMLQKLNTATKDTTPECQRWALVGEVRQMLLVEIRKMEEQSDERG